VFVGEPPKYMLDTFVSLDALEICSKVKHERCSVECRVDTYMRLPRRHEVSQVMNQSDQQGRACLPFVTHVASS
jgi:hypothetical protein